MKTVFVIMMNDALLSVVFSEEKAKTEVARLQAYWDSRPYKYPEAKRYYRYREVKVLDEDNP